MFKSTKRIAIIGAGATGMVQLKNLLDIFSRPEVEYELEVVVFESKPEVGGVWSVSLSPADESSLRGLMLIPDRYSDENEKHHRRAVLTEKGKGKEADHERMYFYPPEDEDPSPMYEGLHTNLPNVSTNAHCSDVNVKAFTEDAAESHRS